MVRCRNCRAPLAVGAESCEYCHTLTAEAFERRNVQAARDRARREAQEANQRAIDQASQAARAAKERALQQAGILARGTWAVVLAAGSVVLVCLPVLSAPAVLLGWSAVARSRREGFPIPTRALVALVLGGLSTLIGVPAWIHAMSGQAAEETRKKSLQAIVAPAVADEALALEAACALAELVLIERGHEGYELGDSEWRCASARIVQTGPRATLLGATIKKGDTLRPVVGCFERDARWNVVELRPEGPCAPAGTGAAVSATPTP